MMERKAIVIGSGLGGLQCAYILAKHGMEVVVLEKATQIGGCLQTFRRRDSGGVCHTFDTGFHYAGGLDEGQSLYPLFKYFGLVDLPWKRLDDECFDEVVFADGDNVSRYPMASGHKHFTERLGELFPLQKAGLEDYTGFLKKVGDNIFRAFSPESGMNGLFSVPAYGFLERTVSDPLLRRVLSGSSLKMELARDSLPLYVFAQINNSFIQSAWRLGPSGVKGAPEGGAMIASRLARSVESMGGRVMTRSEVTRILTDGNDRVLGVEVSGPDGAISEMRADIVVSDAHPAVTVGLVEHCKAFRNIYRTRISGLRNSRGMFTANIALKSGTLPYLNRNLFVHKSGADLWAPANNRTDSVMVHFYVPEGGAAETLDLLSPMSLDADWKNFPEEKREEIRAVKLEECISLASKALPGLDKSVDSVWTSTPATWEHFTGSPGGSAYGVAGDCRNPMSTVLSPRTPLAGLYMTGQSLNLHGMLGVSMTSILTCGAILGMDMLVNELSINE